MLIKGTIITQGYAFGKAYIFNDEKIVINSNKINKSNIDNEINSFLNSYKKTLKQFKKIKLSSKDKNQRLLFDGYILILKDDVIKNGIISLIKNKCFTADAAIDKIIKNQIKCINNVNNIYIKERISDFLDIKKRLILNIKNIDFVDFSFPNINDNIIVVSKELSPFQIMQFDLKKVVGFITEKGSLTSHSSIIAKSLELTSLFGIKNIIKIINLNDNLIIDGLKGNVYINPDISILDKFKLKYSKFLDNKKSLMKLKKLPAVTYDGHKIKLFANIGNNNEIKNIFKNGAEGIGLYRTEFLFMDRDSFPSEEEQYNKYKEIIEFMDDKIVTIRTVDLGGDKFLPYMHFPKENVPFLGWRSIRIYKDRKDILHTQLRAILRSSAYGNVRIMFPMIISIEEVNFLKKEIEFIKNKLNIENIKFNRNIKIGCMIETPAAAIISSHLADELDFFSIGTNDLTQYTLAVDRNNDKVSHLYNPLSPSVLNLIKYTINSVHEKNKKIGMCGELASNEKAIKLLIGLGLDELSMNVNSIPYIKKIIRSSYLSSSKILVNKILMKKTNKEIESILDKKNNF